MCFIMHIHFHNISRFVCCGIQNICIYSCLLQATQLKMCHCILQFLAICIYIPTSPSVHSVDNDRCYNYRYTLVYYVSISV